MFDVAHNMPLIDIVLMEHAADVYLIPRYDHTQPIGRQAAQYKGRIDLSVLPKDCPSFRLIQLARYLYDLPYCPVVVR